MAQIDTIERADALAEAARRIRDHYGERLAALYALPDYPFPDGESTDVDEIPELNLVAILNPPVDVFREIEFAADLTDELYDEVGFYVTTQVVDPGEDLATKARKEGVRI